MIFLFFIVEKSILVGSLSFRVFRERYSNFKLPNPNYAIYVLSLFRNHIMSRSQFLTAFVVGGLKKNKSQSSLNSEKVKNKIQIIIWLKLKKSTDTSRVFFTF